MPIRKAVRRAVKRKIIKSYMRKVPGTRRRVRVKAYKRLA